MSQPRRRRRKRRRGGRADAPDGARAADETGARGGAGSAVERGGRRSRRRRRSASPTDASPRSSEDLVRAVERLDRSQLTAAADGRTLEGVIGELQSSWGVPQSPQEYRITIKVAEERDARGERVAIEEVREEPAPRPHADGAPRREKAPAAPRIGATPVTDADAQAASGRRRRSRRRRRGGRDKPEGSA